MGVLNNVDFCWVCQRLNGKDRFPANTNRLFFNKICGSELFENDSHTLLKNNNFEILKQTQNREDCFVACFEKSCSGKERV